MQQQIASEAQIFVLNWSKSISALHQLYLPNHAVPLESMSTIEIKQFGTSEQIRRHKTRWTDRAIEDLRYFRGGRPNSIHQSPKYQIKDNLNLES